MDVPIVLSTLIVTYCIYRLIKPVFYSTHLNTFPGPEYEGISIVEPFQQGTVSKTIDLFEQYGSVISLKRSYARPILITNDVRAVSHIVLQNQLYEKLPPGERPLVQMLKKGLVVVVGEEHRVQRKALNPAFGPGQIRALTGMFLDKANEMTEHMTALCTSSAPAKVDVLGWVSRCTLDIIGLAGFGYDFAALHGSGKSEMLDAVDKIVQAGARKPWLPIRLLAPFFPTLPMAVNKTIKDNIRVMQRIGMRLVQERKAEALSSGGEKLQKSRDLLSLLVKANMSSSPRDKLSDADLLGQIPTFLIAGHDTTANLLGWAIYNLCCHPTIQDDLRIECRSFTLPARTSGNAPLEVDEMAALDKLSLLDSVIKETLRFNPPSPVTTRMAMADDVIPLSTPVIDKNGTSHDGIPMTKGDPIIIPIIAINQSEQLWGPDAREWKPSRWTQGGPPDTVRSIPGIWGNMLTFFGGSHACIGYRFSIYEAKIILHALMTKFEFRLAVSKEDVVPGSAQITRALLRGREEEGPQLPVLMTLAKGDE